MRRFIRAERLVFESTLIGWVANRIGLAPSTVMTKVILLGVVGFLQVQGGTTMQELEVRAYVLDYVDAKWQYPAGESVFSRTADGDSVCMTSQAINFWHEGKLSSCTHNAETQAWYKFLSQRKR
jgi:hypothetical protein